MIFNCIHRSCVKRLIQSFILQDFWVFSSKVIVLEQESKYTVDLGHFQSSELKLQWQIVASWGEKMMIWFDETKIMMKWKTQWTRAHSVAVGICPYGHLDEHDGENMLSKYIFYWAAQTHYQF